MAKERKPNAWDRPPWPTRGDRLIEKTYEAVGEAISEWERYESILATVFAGFVAELTPSAARRAYCAVRTFEGRCAMLRESSESYFHQNPTEIPIALDRFKDILKNATRFSERRNDIVHGVVGQFRLIDGTQARRIPLTYALFPAYASVKDRDVQDRPGYCYSSVEILYFAKQFAGLVRPASDVAGHLVLQAHNRRRRLVALARSPETTS